MNTLLTISAMIILLNAFLCLYRAFRGPLVQDRILGINIIGTKTLAVLVLVAHIFKSDMYLDIALVYALLNFVVTITVSHYIENTVPKDNNLES